MFEGRDTGYVAGSVLILVATAVSLVGILSPGWLQFKEPTFKNITNEGLFLECSRSHASCGAINLMDIQDFEMWTHAIISIGIIALFISSFFVIVFNCRTRATDCRQKMVEGFGVYGGFFILIGIINYVSNDNHKLNYSYGYAFFLTVLSSLLAVTGGALVALFNRKSRVPDHVEDDVEEGREEKEEEEGARGSDYQIEDVICDDEGRLD